MYVDYSGQNPIGAIAVAALPYATAGLLIISIGLLIYDATHEQILYNLVSDTIDYVAEVVKENNSISNTVAPPNSLDDTADQSEKDENGNPVVKPGQQPTERDGYIAPKGGPVKGKTKDGKVGWKDKSGNIWIPAPTGSKQGHGGGHWDVQSPKGGYTNVYPGGMTRGGKAPYPQISIFP